MDDNKKAEIYNRLMYENDVISNEIASVRGENLEMNETQQQRIYKLQPLRTSFDYKLILKEKLSESV